MSVMVQNKKKTKTKQMSLFNFFNENFHIKHKFSQSEFKCQTSGYTIKNPQTFI